MGGPSSPLKNSDSPPSPHNPAGSVVRTPRIEQLCREPDRLTGRIVTTRRVIAVIQRHAKAASMKGAGSDRAPSIVSFRAAPYANWRMPYTRPPAWNPSP
jgi:hypothetical protein